MTLTDLMTSLPTCRARSSLLIFFKLAAGRPTPDHLGLAEAVWGHTIINISSIYIHTAAAARIDRDADLENSDAIDQRRVVCVEIDDDSDGSGDEVIQVLGVGNEWTPGDREPNPVEQNIGLDGVRIAEYHAGLTVSGLPSIVDLLTALRHISTEGY